MLPFFGWLPQHVRSSEVFHKSDTCFTDTHSIAAKNTHPIGMYGIICCKSFLIPAQFHRLLFLPLYSRLWVDRNCLPCPCPPATLSSPSSFAMRKMLWIPSSSSPSRNLITACTPYRVNVWPNWRTNEDEKRDIKKVTRLHFFSEQAKRSVHIFPNQPFFR